LLTFKCYLSFSFSINCTQNISHRMFSSHSLSFSFLNPFSCFHD
jgi:hypothetical protein